MDPRHARRNRFEPEKALRLPLREPRRVVRGDDPGSALRRPWICELLHDALNLPRVAPPETALEGHGVEVVTRHLAIEHGFTFEHESIPVTVSIGLASLSDNLRSPEAFVELADRKLYEAWNRQDPPDSFERERNRRIRALQGNANPFVGD